MMANMYMVNLSIALVRCITPGSPWATITPGSPWATIAPGSPWAHKVENDLMDFLGCCVLLTISFENFTRIHQQTHVKRCEL